MTKSLRKCETNSKDSMTSSFPLDSESSSSAIKSKSTSWGCVLNLIFLQCNQKHFLKGFDCGGEPLRRIMVTSLFSWKREIFYSFLTSLLCRRRFGLSFRHCVSNIKNGLCCDNNHHGHWLIITDYNNHGHGELVLLIMFIMTIMMLLWETWIYPRLSPTMMMGWVWLKLMWFKRAWM